jgi:hypothetical protein
VCKYYYQKLEYLLIGRHQAYNKGVFNHFGFSLRIGEGHL